MSKLFPASKVKAISQSCNETLSLGSKSSLLQKLSNEAENPLVGIHQSVSKKHDKTSNCVCHLMLNTSPSAGSVEKAKKTYQNLNWMSLQQAFQKDIDDWLLSTTKQPSPKLKNHQLKQLKRF